MASGGARSRSGPARDPNALRRDRPSDKADWIVLPAAGREGPVPEWPIGPGDPEKVNHPRELVLWAELWGLPQAVEWERLRQERDVALYVRLLALAEAEGPKGTELRIRGDDLGVSMAGMAKRLWRLESDADRAGPSVKPAGRSGRDRLKVVGS